MSGWGEGIIDARFRMKIKYTIPEFTNRRTRASHEAPHSKYLIQTGEPPMDSTKERLKTIIIESLHLDGITPDMIGDDAQLFGGELGLDSVDALELVVALEKEFDVRIESDEATREAFASVNTLASFVEGAPERQNVESR